MIVVDRVLSSKDESGGVPRIDVDETALGCMTGSMGVVVDSRRLIDRF